MAKVKYYAKENSSIGTHSFYAVPIPNGTAIQAGMSPWDVFYKAGNMFVQPTGIHENTDY